MKKIKATTRSLLASTILALGLLAPSTAYASGQPDQAACDTTIGSFAWSTMGIARPVVESMSVDGEIIADPTHPLEGSVGVSICAGEAQGRIVGLSVYYHHTSGGVNLDSTDLTAATTPAGHAITSSSKISITLTNMGDLAKYYTFSLVHGAVSSWTTANLGAPSASLSLTFSPVRTPEGTGSQFGSCTATPPNCTAPKSDDDILGASLAMTFDQAGYGNDVSGSYFALTGAMGGFVTSQQASDGSHYLVASLGAPHSLADGVTPNVGNMQAFLPTSVVENLLGLPAGGVDTSTLTVTRTESGDTIGVPFTVTAVSGGYVISVTDITFSSPVYTIKKATASPGAPNTGFGAATANPWQTLSVYSLASLALGMLAVTLRKRLAPRKVK